MKQDNPYRKFVCMVRDHLQSIDKALDEFDKMYSANTNEALSRHIRELTAKMKALELESANTKKMLKDERRRSHYDALTGLPNRISYYERGFHELQRYKRYKRCLTLAVCQIDMLDKLNDMYGHSAAGKVVKLISSVILKNVRKVDFVARLENGHFVIVMPETTGEQAQAILSKVCHTIKNMPFKFQSNRVHITTSFGVTECAEEDTLESVYNRAETALSDAEKSGSRSRCHLVLKNAPLDNQERTFPKLVKSRSKVNSEAS